MLSPTKHTRDLSGNLFIYLPPNAVYVSYVPIVSQTGAAVNVFFVDAAIMFPLEIVYRFIGLVFSQMKQNNDIFF